MNKKQNKCLVCGGTIGYDAKTNKYSCFNCNASHTSDLFDTSKSKGVRFHITKLRIIFAILGALYLLYWLFRVMIY